MKVIIFKSNLEIEISENIAFINYSLIIKLKYN